RCSTIGRPWLHLRPLRKGEFLRKIPETLLRAVFLSFTLLLAGWSVAQHELHADTLSTANDAEVSTVEAIEFNAGQLIMGHIVDEHGWHIAGDLTLPLPIILYDTERGF